MFARLFGRKSEARAARQEPQLDGDKPRLNPKLAGGFLLHQWLLSEDSKFGFTPAEIDEAGKNLPEPVREHFPFWVHLYLAWLMRGIAGSKYGREFQIEMMAHVFARLENSYIPEVNVPVDTLRTFLNHMDEALRIYIETNDSKDQMADLVSFQMFAATRLLTFTDGGMFKDDKDAFGDAIFALGDALMTIDNKARPLLSGVVERTAESQEPL